MDAAIEDFEDLVDPISYDKRVFWMQQCYSGGFIDNLEGLGTLITTAGHGDESTFAADNNNPMELIY